MGSLVIILFISTSAFLPTEANEEKKFKETNQCHNGTLEVSCNRGEVIHVHSAQLGTCEDNKVGNNKCCNKKNGRTYNPYLKLIQEVNGRPHLKPFQVTEIDYSHKIHFVRLSYSCVNTTSVNEHVKELSKEGESKLDDSSYLLYASSQRTSRLQSCNCALTATLIGSSVQLVYCRLENKVQLKFNGTSTVCATSDDRRNHQSQSWVFEDMEVALLELNLGSNRDNFIFMNVSGSLSINCTVTRHTASTSNARVSRQTTSSTATIDPTPARDTQNNGLSSTTVIVIAVLSGLLLLAAIVVVAVIVLRRRRHALKKDGLPPRLELASLDQSARPFSCHEYDYIAAGNAGVIAGDSATYEYTSVQPVPGVASNAQRGRENNEYFLPPDTQIDRKRMRNSTDKPGQPQPPAYADYNTPPEAPESSAYANYDTQPEKPEPCAYADYNTPSNQPEPSAYADYGTPPDKSEPSAYADYDTQTAVAGIDTSAYADYAAPYAEYDATDAARHEKEPDSVGVQRASPGNFGYESVDAVHAETTTSNTTLEALDRAGSVLPPAVKVEPNCVYGHAEDI